MRRICWCIFVLAIVSAGCGPDDKNDTSKPSSFGYQKSVPAALREEGRLAYIQYCVGCHGERGDGNGEAAVFLDPKPRNFINAQFKFSSTRSGRLPTDEDMRRTIRNGLRGSAMPPFNLLSERTIEGLVAYIKEFSPRWKDDDPTPPIPTVDDPFRRVADKSEAIRRGEAVYHGFAVCWSCHPAYVPEPRVNEYIVQFGGTARSGFRSNLHRAEGKPNEEQQLVYPPDFRRDFVRAGASVSDLYRSIAAGISGTAMPTWVDSIETIGSGPADPSSTSRVDLWAMAYYVQDLMKQRPALLAEGSFETRERPRAIYLHGAPPPAAPAEESEVPASTQPAGDAEFVE